MNHEPVEDADDDEAPRGGDVEVPVPPVCGHKGVGRCLIVFGSRSLFLQVASTPVPELLVIWFVLREDRQRFCEKRGKRYR